MLRRKALLRSASKEYYKRAILAGRTSPEYFACIECGTANLIIKEMYDGDIEKWSDIVNNMGTANPKLYNYMIKNPSQFLNEYIKTI